MSAGYTAGASPAATRAAVAVAPLRTELQSLALPRFGDDAGLLEVEATGVCGSDWPYYKHYPQERGPLILGHETVGHVSALGSVAAKRWGVKEGDRVALEEYLPCGHCEYCLSGDLRLCEATELRAGTLRYGSTGLSEAPGLWGGYSEYLYLHPNTVFHKLPAHIPPRHATLALPLGNGIEWVVRQGKVAPGQTVVIQGPGQQGLACVIAAKEAGASTIIVTGLGRPADRLRLAVAKKLGADHTIDVESEDLLQGVADITSGRMADVVVDCAAGGPATVTAAIRLARKRGTILLAAQKQTRLPEFDSDALISRFLTVKGMRGHSFEAVETAIRIIARGRYPLHEMCTHLFGLDQVDLALRSIGGTGLDDAIHMCIDPWQ
jgi:threonine dehydrogenase-like Zn-dependent dehydrogenase